LKDTQTTRYARMDVARARARARTRSLVRSIAFCAFCAFCAQRPTANGRRLFVRRNFVRGARCATPSLANVANNRVADNDARHTFFKISRLAEESMHSEAAALRRHCGGIAAALRRHRGGIAAPRRCIARKSYNFRRLAREDDPRAREIDSPCSIERSRAKDESSNERIPSGKPISNR